VGKKKNQGFCGDEEKKEEKTSGRGQSLPFPTKSQEKVKVQKGLKGFLGT